MDTPITNEKLLTVLRGLSPEALRAVIAELSKLGPSTAHAPADGHARRRPAPGRGRRTP